MDEALKQLTTTNLDDLMVSFGLQDRPLLGAPLRAVFHAPAEQFARQMLEFDRGAENGSLPGAARRALPAYVADLRAYGRENLPASGPLIVLANHPGLSDTLCLFAAINRPDLRVIAVDRPFLRALRNISAHLIFVSEDSAQRVSALKNAAVHLKQGGAILTFPAGQIEPDPALREGAIESLDRWVDSAGLLLRLVPGAVIVPAAVRGVFWDKAAEHPLTRVRREPEDRERLGAALQLLSHLAFGKREARPQVQFGRPISLEEVGSNKLEAIHATLLARMRGLLEAAPQGSGEALA